MLSNTAILLEPAGIFVRKCSSIATFSLVIWDGIVSCNREYKYIWKNSSPVKWIYLFSRYYGIAAQAANVVFIAIPLSEFPVAPQTCMLWFGLQMVSFIFHLTALQAILILRVYALYQQSLKIGTLLTSLLGLSVALSFTFCTRAFNALKFDSACNAQEPALDVIYFGVTTVCLQGMIWVLTIRKRGCALLDEWGKVSAVNILTRDTTRVCIGVSSMFVSTVFYAFLVQIAVHVIFLWPNAVMSILTCRLVLNLQHLRSNPPTTDLELTTHVGLLEAVDDDSV